MNAEAREVARVANPFGSTVVAAPTGAASASMAHREVAEVQAAMIIAKNFPRDEAAAMDRILTACARDSLAELALYSYARGGQEVTGPSIRLAEELGRRWGNMLYGITELSRSNGISECLAYAWDLETNVRDEKRFSVRHWRDTKNGGYALKEERDIYELVANMGARRKRACILAVIPGDVVERAVNQVEVTLNTKEAVTPERIKLMLEEFGKFGVSKEHIEKRIQRKIDSISAAQMVQLRTIRNSLKDGMSSAGDWFEIAPPAAADGGQKTATDNVKDKLAARANKPSTGDKPAQPSGNKQDAPLEGSAIAQLKAQDSIEHLDEMWGKLKDQYAAAGVPIPQPVENTKIQLREVLAEREGRLDI